MNIVSRVVLVSSWLSLAAAGAGCGDLADVYTPAEGAGYTPEGTLVIYTPAGIKLYDATLRQERGTIVLDPTSGGLPVDVPIGFDLSADGRVAAVGYSNTVTNDVALFAIPGGRRLTTLDVPGGAFPVQGVAISAHGALVYVQGPSSGIFDVASGARLWGRDDQVWLDSPCFSADEQTLFGAYRGRLQAFEARGGAARFDVDAGGSVVALAPLSDGATLLGAVVACSEGGTPPGQCSGAGTVVQSYVVWSAADGARVREFPAFAGTFAKQNRVIGARVVCAPAGDRCAVSVADQAQGQVVIFQPDGTLLRALPGGADGFAFSPDGALLGVASGSARVYRLDDGALLGERSYSYGVFQ